LEVFHRIKELLSRPFPQPYSPYYRGRTKEYFDKYSGPKSKEAEAFLKAAFKNKAVIGKVSRKKKLFAPCYIPELDQIISFPLYYYSSYHDYYRCMCHELTHATGNGKRLARATIVKGWDNPKLKQFCAYEEMIADMGSCLVMHRLGLDIDYESMAHYICGYARVFRMPGMYMWRAFAEAIQASDFLFEKVGVKPVR
jgi:antirestriction protein ArdC